MCESILYIKAENVIEFFVVPSMLLQSYLLLEAKIIYHYYCCLLMNKQITFCKTIYFTYKYYYLPAQCSRNSSVIVTV